MLLLSVTKSPEEIESAIQKGLSGLADLPENAGEVNQYVTKLWTMLEEYAVTYGGKLVIALILTLVGFKLVNLCNRKIQKSRAMSKLEPSTRRFTGSIIGLAFKIMIAITALSVLGVPMTSMITVIGSCGLAIGLALQGSLANIAGGFILLILKPFSTGDFISMSEVSGTVEDIGIFHTKILTMDNKRIIVPNSTISNATLTNFSSQKERRVDLTFTASYGDDVNRVEGVLARVCRENPKVLENPRPFARLSAHNDSALEYTVRVWCKTEDYWDVYYGLIKEVKYAFDEAGISIPFPQIDVNNAQKS